MQKIRHSKLSCGDIDHCMILSNMWTWSNFQYWSIVPFLIQFLKGSIHYQVIWIVALFSLCYRDIVLCALSYQSFIYSSVDSVPCEASTSAGTLFFLYWCKCWSLVCCAAFNQQKSVTVQEQSIQWINDSVLFQYTYIYI